MNRPTAGIISVLLGLLLQGQAHSHATLPAARGTLSVTVLDESGEYVPDAHVYIFGNESKRLVDGQDTNGVATFSLNPGSYRVYSAVTKKTGDYIDHFSSLEAHVWLSDEGNASVILTLKKMQNPAFYLSEYARKKIGLDEKLAKYVN